SGATPMQVISMSTEILPQSNSTESWREAICKMIHRVQVRDLAPQDFSARISGRGYGTVSCASFWSKPHQVYSRREQLSDSGASGYLLSWQLDGVSLIEQGAARIKLEPGKLAIVDARRPMSITFPDNVRRIVAKLPPEPVEQRLPVLRRLHTTCIAPPPSMGQILLSYLTELSDGDSRLTTSDAELLADNISNL